jgi:hypothetical protein
LFNLLMRGFADEGGRGTMPASRLLEYTDDDLTNQFKNNGKILIDKLLNFPCLFMVEGVGDQLARVGTVTRARIVGRELSFDFTFDLDIPPILNSIVAAKATEFGIFNDCPHALGRQGR